MHLTDTCEVEIFGVGGRTVDKAIRFDLDAITSTAPNVVILELDFNDVCDRDSDADAIASGLAALAELMLSVCNIQFFVVCQILPRKRPPFEDYNDRVRQVNKLVSEALLPVKLTKFWKALKRTMSNSML